MMRISLSDSKNINKNRGFQMNKTILWTIMLSETTTTTTT